MTATMRRVMTTIEKARRAAIVQQEAEQAQLEADRYRALHALEVFQQDLRDARAKFFQYLDEHNLTDWVARDAEQDYHMIRTVDEYRELK
jgi:hypothetical protein